MTCDFGPVICVYVDVSSYQEFFQDVPYFSLKSVHLFSSKIHHCSTKRRIGSDDSLRTIPDSRCSHHRWCTAENLLQRMTMLAGGVREWVRTEPGKVTEKCATWLQKRWLWNFTQREWFMEGFDYSYRIEIYLTGTFVWTSELPSCPISCSPLSAQLLHNSLPMSSAGISEVFGFFPCPWIHSEICLYWKHSQVVNCCQAQTVPSCAWYTHYKWSGTFLLLQYGMYLPRSVHFPQHWLMPIQRPSCGRSRCWFSEAYETLKGPFGACLVKRCMSTGR